MTRSVGTHRIPPASRIGIACALLGVLPLALAPACGGTRSGPVGPAVAPPDAAPVVVRPTRADCEHAVTHLLELYGEPANDATPTDVIDQLVDDCTTHATADAVACVLQATNRDTLAQCGGLQ